MNASYHQISNPIQKRIFLSLLLIVFACAFQSSNLTGQVTQSAEKGPSGGRKKGQREPTAVKTIKITSKVVPLLITSRGILQGLKQINIYSKVPGKVTFLGPKEGDKVTPSTVLLRVDRSDPGDSFIPTPITSPIEGWVGKWFVTSIGTQVSPQDPIVTIVDDLILRAKLSLPITHWQKLTADTKVRFQVLEPTSAVEKFYPAKIHSIARIGDGLSSRGSVTLEMDNARHELKAGTPVTSVFEIAPAQRLIIPTSALSLTDQGNFVYIRDGEKALKRAVRFLAFDNDRIEILSGLSDGEEIITEGVHLISDGAQIKVVTAPEGQAQ